MNNKFPIEFSNDKGNFKIIEEETLTTETFEWKLKIDDNISFEDKKKVVSKSYLDKLCYRDYDYLFDSYLEAIFYVNFIDINDHPNLFLIKI